MDVDPAPGRARASLIVWFADPAVAEGGRRPNRDDDDDAVGAFVAGLAAEHAGPDADAHADVDAATDPWPAYAAAAEGGNAFALAALTKTIMYYLDRYNIYTNTHVQLCLARKPLDRGVERQFFGA